MSDKKPFDDDFILLLFLAFSFPLLGYLYWDLLQGQFPVEDPNAWAKMGQFGDSFAPLNWVISCVSLVALIATLESQRRQLKLQQEQNEAQQKAIDYNTRLEALQTLIDSIKSEIETAKTRGNQSTLLLEHELSVAISSLRAHITAQNLSVLRQFRLLTVEDIEELIHKHTAYRFENAGITAEEVLVLLRPTSMNTVERLTAFMRAYHFHEALFGEFRQTLLRNSNPPCSLFEFIVFGSMIAEMPHFTLAPITARLKNTQEYKTIESLYKLAESEVKRGLPYDSITIIVEAPKNGRFSEDGNLFYVSGTTSTYLHVRDTEREFRESKWAVILRKAGRSWEAQEIEIDGTRQQVA